MSILNVEHLTHGFGDRAIFDDVLMMYRSDFLRVNISDLSEPMAKVSPLL